MTRNYCKKELESAGIIVKSVSGGEIHCLCPFHEDNNTSMSVNYDKELWICFAGCGRGTLNSLWERLEYHPTDYYPEEFRIQYEEDTSVQEALESMDVTLGVDANSLISISSRIPLHESQLHELCSDAGVYTDNKTGRLIFYSTDIAGNVVGFNHRGINDKGKNIGKVHLGVYLPEKLKFLTERDIVVVEGPIDALCVYISGSDFICTFGTSVTDKQVDIIASYNDVTIFMDSDAPGRQSSASIAKRLFSKGVVPKVVSWGKETTKDPGDLRPGEIVNMIDTAEIYWGY